MIMTNADFLRIAQAQIAIDMSCAASDFSAGENIVVVSRADERASAYLDLPLFCALISYGGNIVASVDGRIEDFARRHIASMTTSDIFGPRGCRALDSELRQYGYTVEWMAEYWLPDTERLRPLPCAYETRVLERGEFEDLYQLPWSNALSKKRPHLDTLAVAAYDGGELIGLAGCSADSAELRQIGIDVLPEYRRRGVASALTSRIAVEIIERGNVPYYGCAWSNIGSAANAVKSGFRPAWVHLSAVKAE
ncbi:MAG: GNAT family N-acetyltransferase [Oscillospiraceae bacterium]|jgi:GNAT superfamily N-acetyltransferase|nr:GNAT family N-acetyltransferase [Oscillospiraceae bacterium]